MTVSVQELAHTFKLLPTNIQLGELTNIYEWSRLSPKHTHKSAMPFLYWEKI